MNIDDVNTDTIDIPPTHAIMPALFGHQRVLAIKYGPIETKNGFYHPDFDNVPHIDDARFQHWIKDMFWRTTEEIAEALEVVDERTNYLNWKMAWTSDANLRHLFEEFADALHFLTEVSVATEYNPDDLNDFWDGNEHTRPRTVLPAASLEILAARVIFDLGLAANCLKNKPWKLSQMPTDRNKFLDRLHRAWCSFVKLWTACGFTRQDVYCLYMKKNLVNQFRQRSAY